MNFESWVWQPEITVRKGQIAFIQNEKMPFLKGQWVFPGEITKVVKKPAKFDVKHGITKYDIYIQIIEKKLTTAETEKVRWVALSDVKKVNPTSLIQKILQQGLK